jgi:membrane dipeptidase
MSRLAGFLLALLPWVAAAQSYQKIHNSAILVDTHNDFLSKSLENHYAFDADLRGLTQTDLSRMRKGGVDVQIFSIFCDEHYGRGSAFAYANRELDSLYSVAARHPKEMQIVYTWAQLMQAVKGHKLAVLSGVEGGHMMEDDLTYLDSFYRRGVRYMTLTWNNSTSWATSASDESKHSFIVTPYGLTAFGKEVVRKMNELGMMVDVSHTGEKTFWDVIHTSSKPVIASHSSAYALCPVFRNLKDDQIKAIAQNGGVIQVNFYSGFLDSLFMPRLNQFLKLHRAEQDSLSTQKMTHAQILDSLFARHHQELENLRPPLSLLLDHIDYIVKLAGIDHVGIGSDFDGSESTPQGLDGVEDYPKLTRGLIERGYNREEIFKILGGNFLRVFKANENHP